MSKLITPPGNQISLPMFSVSVLLCNTEANMIFKKRTNGCTYLLQIIRMLVSCGQTLQVSLRRLRLFQ